MSEITRIPSSTRPVHRTGFTNKRPNASRPPRQAGLPRHRAVLGDSRLSDREVMRSHAARVLGDGYREISTCGTLKNPQEQVGMYWHAGGHLAFDGVRYCSRFWVCPVCSPIVIRGRNLALLNVWAHRKAQGAQCATFTLTAGFPEDMPTAERFGRFQAAFSRLTRGRHGFSQHWKDHALLGYCAVVEVLYHTGTNGWRPHFHGVALFEGPVPEAFREWLAGEWKKAVRSNGLDDGDGTAVDDRFEDEKAAVAYICQPMEDQDPEEASLTPMQVLRASTTGESVYIHAFCDYAAGIKGHRHLHHSRNFFDGVDGNRAKSGVTRGRGLIQHQVTPEHYEQLLDDCQVSLYLSRKRDEIRNA